MTPAWELPGEYCDVIADCAEPVVQWQVVTEAADSHALADVRAMGADERLGAGVDRLRRWRPDAILWACTCASFVLGRAAAVEQCRTLGARAGVPWRSTSVALVGALRALGEDTVAILSPYPGELTDALVAFLAEWGVAVEAVRWLDRPTARRSELLDADALAGPLAELPGRARVLIPDTAVWGMEVCAELARRTDRPLLASNQVTVWTALALLGLPTGEARLGDLAGEALTDVVAGEPTGA